MKIKIAFLMYHVITGGIENCLVQILNQLKEFPEYDITVISRKPVTEKRFLDFFEKNNIRLIDSRMFDNASKKRPAKFLPRKLWRIQCAIERHKRIKALRKYDVLVDYFNGSLDGSFHNILKKVRKPSIAFIHLSFEVYTRNNNYIRNMRAYNRIVSISKSFYDDLMARHPENADKFEFIYNPIDVDAIRNRAKDAKPLTDDTPYFVQVARLHQDKDHETLLFGFMQFLQNENYPNVKLYLCGDGELRDRWKKLVHNLRLDDYVVFAGNVTNPFGYVRGAMAHILSTFGEGLPTVLIEAQALGTINIASDVKSGVGEILMNGNAGLLFPAGDAAALAACMSDVYHKRIDIQAHIKNASQNLDRFACDKIIVQLDKLFKEVAANK